MAGGRAVRLVTLNDATRRAGNWTPGARRARTPARRRATTAPIAYIGAFNSGASAVSIPILNEAGDPMISPSNTAIGLTTGGPGTTRGEPEKYYPGRQRDLLPDHPQRQGPGRGAGDRDARPRLQAVVSVHDGEVYGKRRRHADAPGRGAARAAGRRAPSDRPQRTRSFGRIRGADCVVYTGITANGAVRMFRSVGAAAQRAAVRERRRGRVRLHPPPAAPRSRAASRDRATLAPDAYPAPRSSATATRTRSTATRR